MFAFVFRAAAAALILALAQSSAGSAADAPADQTRIDDAVQAYAASQRAEQEAARDRNVANRMAAILNDPGTQVLGNPDGDVTLVEFFDYACPFCKAVEPRLEQLLKDDKGVKLVVKEFPILTPESLVASKIALAAARQGKYEAFHIALMNFRGRLQEAAIFDVAQEVGLDVERLRADMNAPEIADAIVGNFNLARALRVYDTPTFIIGTHMVTTPSSQIDFPQMVAAERKK